MNFPKLVDGETHMSETFRAVHSYSLCPLFFIKNALAEVWILELSRPLTSQESGQILFEQFSDYPTDYFRRLYRAEGKLSSLENNCKV